MTIDEAIKWNKEIDKWLMDNFREHPFMTSDLKAIQLGIEALGREQNREEKLTIGLEERVRVNDLGQAIILVGQMTEQGVVFNDWWKSFRKRKPLPSETEK